MRLGGQEWTGLVMLSKHQNYRMIRRIRYNVMCNVKWQHFNIIINSSKVGDGGGSVDLGGDLHEARQPGVGKSSNFSECLKYKNRIHIDMVYKVPEKL